MSKEISNSLNEVQAGLSRGQDYSCRRVLLIKLQHLRCCIYLDVVKVVENIVNTVMFLFW